MCCIVHQEKRHIWVMTREPDGSVVMWETSSASRCVLPERHGQSILYRIIIPERRGHAIAYYSTHTAWHAYSIHSVLLLEMSYKV